MDKLKVFLAVMKKQHFWVMSGLVLIVGLVGWALATSSLSTEYKASRGKIEGIFKDLDQLRGQERENEDWIVGVKKETKVLKQTVKSAWEDVYAEQRDQVLRWPKVLGEDFLRIVPQLPPNEEIPVNQRERYWNYVQEEFPRLLEIVDARSYLDKSEEEAQRDVQRGRPAAKLGPPGAADDAQKIVAHDYKVRWDKGDQEAIDRRLDWKSTPTTHEVRETQEDLWVYQALLTIIRHLNDRADGHHNAKVKEIKSLLIGHDAAQQFQAGMAEGRIEHPEAMAQNGAPGAPGAMPGAMTNKLKPPTAPMTGMTGAPGQTKGAVDDGGRYVDEKGMPLASATAAPPEFKRMPILMQLLIDQREISRLLVECANSPLPIEVRQLRITPAERSTSVVAGRPVPGRSGGLNLGGGAAMGRPRVGGGGNLNADEERDKNPYDVIVELQGIIYIFNPPDLAKLAPAATDEPAAVDPGAAAPADESADAAATEGPPADEPAGQTDATDAEEPAADTPADGDKPAAEAEQPDDEAMDGKAGDSKAGDSEPTDAE